MNANDIKRQQILEWFYARNSNASSHRGKNGSAVKISDANKGMKEAYQLKPQKWCRNLTYLVDKGWISLSEIEKQVRTKTGTTIPPTTVWYEISAAGIDKIEGASEFQANHRYAGTNITETGRNIVTLGDGNVINAAHQELDHELATLKEAIAASPQMDDGDKLDASVDIETLRDQLVKESPDKTIVGRLWCRIEPVATMNDFTEAVSRIAPLIAGLLS